MKPHDYYYLAKKNVLSDADFRTRIVGNIKKGSKIHVSYVCGKAMASIACMLKDLGYKVTGSDDHFYPPMSTVLESHGIKKLEPNEKNLEDVDLIVVGNTSPYNAIEAEVARRKNIPMISGSEAVAQIFSKKRSLVVAGTHGKTTTSALLTHIFINSGNAPAYMIGGVFQNSKDSYSIGSKKSKYVIYEGDEYNSAFFDRGPKFLRYNPSSIILTSIEHDHFDLYPSFQDYKQAFQFLVDEIPKGGFLVLHDSVLKYIDTKKTKGKVFTYGKDQKSDFYFTITNIDKNGTAFDIKSKKFGTIKNIFVPMFGEYNVENTLSVIALSLLEGVSKSKIITAVSTFSGTKQRQELIGQKKNGVIVVRDYAHHPTAVRLTIDGLKLHYPDKRLVVVFEPRSNSSRRKIFESGYTNALEKADVTIVVSPPFLADKDSKSDFMDVSVIQKELGSKGKKSFAPKNCTEALLVAVKTQKKDDVFVFMSSGDFEGIPDKFLTL